MVSDEGVMHTHTPASSGCRVRDAKRVKLLLCVCVRVYECVRGEREIGERGERDRRERWEREIGERDLGERDRRERYER